ncbi:MAG: uncharacterized protein KVP18_005203, partial [Porospora cf. gigantea A]|uniref:uncharacterized protein n=1 Tax=Porospora cf. gigantea A TaxID=2853593 RepID=UPI00355A6FE2
YAAFDNLETAIFKIIRATTSSEQPVTPTLSHEQNRAIVKFFQNALFYLYPLAEDISTDVQLLTVEATNSLKVLKANPASGTTVATVNPPHRLRQRVANHHGAPYLYYSGPKKSGLSGGAIAGITVGSIAAAGLLVTVGSLCNELFVPKLFM